MCTLIADLAGFGIGLQEREAFVLIWQGDFSLLLTE